MHFDHLRFRVALKRFNNVSRMVADLGSMVVQVASHPTLLGAVGAALHVGGNFLAHQMESLKSTPNWPKTDLVIHPDLSEFADPDLPGLFHVGGQRIYVPPKKKEIFFVEKSVDQFKDWVREWEWGTKNEILLQRNEKGEMALAPVGSAPALSSPRTEELWARLKPCLDAGVSRSALLDGPPGVGKSTAARVLVSRVGGRRLRIVLDDDMPIGLLQNFVEFLQPDAIVIDDFDRLGVAAMDLLDFLERCRSTIKLLVVTSNNMGNLDLAVVRPGRFDEIFPMVSLGSDYLRPQVGEALWSALTEEQREALVDWPASHINELRIRHTHLICDLNEEYEDLAERVHKNRQVESSVSYHPTPTKYKKRYGSAVYGDDDEEEDGEDDDETMAQMAQMLKDRA